MRTTIYEVSDSSKAPYTTRIISCKAWKLLLIILSLVWNSGIKEAYGNMFNLLLWCLGKSWRNSSLHYSSYENIWVKNDFENWRILNYSPIICANIWKFIKNLLKMNGYSTTNHHRHSLLILLRSLPTESVSTSDVRYDSRNNHRAANVEYHLQPLCSENGYNGKIRMAYDLRPHHYYKLYIYIYIYILCNTLASFQNNSMVYCIDQFES